MFNCWVEEELCRDDKVWTSEVWGIPSEHIIPNTVEIVRSNVLLKVTPVTICNMPMSISKVITIDIRVIIG